MPGKASGSALWVWKAAASNPPRKDLEKIGVVLNFANLDEIQEQASSYGGQWMENSRFLSWADVAGSRMV